VFLAIKIGKIVAHKLTLIRVSIIKAAVRSFFWVKKDPKYIFEKIHNHPVFKTILPMLNSKW